MTSTEPLLSAIDLVAGYTEPVVGPVTFSVGRDEIVGLSGPNGSGKTTLFNAVIGVARILGGRVTRHPDARISLQRQNPIRLGEMPLVGRELLELTGSTDTPVPAPLQSLMQVRVDRVSGGQFQLLQVWACLGAPSELVLLDEPTNNMDPAAIDALAALLEQPGTNRGVLLISHEQRFLERVCSRIVAVAP